MSDSYVTGSVDGGTQQQFCLRNNHYQQWSGGSWNQDSLGNDGPLPPWKDSQHCSTGKGLVFLLNFLLFFWHF